MQCALCHQNKQLCDSHIVPEFLYQGIYDQKHSFFTLSRDPQKANHRFGKGLREPLLCSYCEVLFSKWEGYASEFFYSGKITPQVAGELFLFEKIKYAELKLFLLSLLWRFAVTRIHELQGAKLIDKHIEKLRLMLLASNPGAPLEFPCYLQIITHEGNFFGQFIMPPMVAKYESHHVWQFAVAGFYFMFFVSSHEVLGDIAKTFLNVEGKMIVMATEFRKTKALYDFGMELGKASLARKQIPKSQLNWKR